MRLKGRCPMSVKLTHDYIGIMYDNQRIDLDYLCAVISLNDFYKRLDKTARDYANSESGDAEKIEKLWADCFGKMGEVFKEFFIHVYSDSPLGIENPQSINTQEYGVDGIGYNTKRGLPYFWQTKTSTNPRRYLNIGESHISQMDSYSQTLIRENFSAKNYVVSSVDECWRKDKWDAFAKTKEGQKQSVQAVSDAVVMAMMIDQRIQLVISNTQGVNPTLMEGQFTDSQGCRYQQIKYDDMKAKIDPQGNSYFTKFKEAILSSLKG